jgi:hypothetical protein
MNITSPPLPAISITIPLFSVRAFQDRFRFALIPYLVYYCRHYFFSLLATAIVYYSLTLFPRTVLPSIHHILPQITPNL